MAIEPTAASALPAEAGLEPPRPSRLAAVARWGFPLVTLVVGVAVQIALPRILQLGLSETEYVVYVAVTALAAYAELADAGFQISVTRELSALHGAGKSAVFLGEARRAARIFAVVIVVAMVVVGLGLSSVLGTTRQLWPGATEPGFVLSVVALLAATCLTLGLGGLHSSLLLSTNRLLSSQAVSLGATVLPLGALVVGLVSSRSLPVGLFAQAATMGTITLLRALHAGLLLRKAASEVSPRPPEASLGKVLGAAVALKVSGVLAVAAFPHLLSVLAAPLVPTAIPARTYAAACRLVSQQFAYLLQVHVTRRMAGGGSDQARGTADFRVSAGLMTAVHLVQVGLAAAVVVPVFRLWLPPRADEVVAFLPGILAEQVMLSVTLPCSILYAAADRLRTQGLVRIVGVALGIAALVIALPHWKSAAFGLALAVAETPLFLVSLWAELRGAWGFPARSRTTIARYATATACLVAAAAYASQPLLASAFILGCALPLFAVSALALLRRWRQMGREAEADPGKNG